MIEEEQNSLLHILNFDALNMRNALPEIKYSIFKKSFDNVQNINDTLTANISKLSDKLEYTQSKASIKGEKKIL